MRLVLASFGRAPSRAVLNGLHKHGVATEVAATTDDVATLLSQYACDALVIMACGDEAEVAACLRKARLRHAGLPILIYGADDARGRADSLDAGADEAVCAGCDLTELVARLRAIIRRSKGHSVPCVRRGNLTMDVNTACIRIAGAKLDVTRKELRMLEALVLSGGSTVTKAQLLDALYFGGEERDEGIISVFLCMIRKKLKEAGADIEIETYRGVGYALRETAARRVPGRAFLPAGPEYQPSAA